MKYLLLLVCSILFSVGFAQENLSKNEIREQYFVKGVDLFHAGQYQKALECFIESKYSSKTNEDIYYYLAASSFYSGKPSKTTFKYIDKGIFRKNDKTILFYTAGFPYSSENLDKELFLLFLTKDVSQWGFHNFCKANILAKSGDMNGFVYLEEAMRSNYRIPTEYKNNPVRALDTERYFEIMKKYNVFYYEDNIREYVESRTSQWQQKGKFEKTEAYKKRVTDINRTIIVKAFVQEYIDSVGSLEFDFEAIHNEYDADNEVYKLKFRNDKYIYLSVPLAEAKTFDQNFYQLSYENASFTLSNNNFDLMHVEIVDEQHDKTYIYDSKEVLAFNSNSLNLQLDDIVLSKTDNFDYTPNPSSHAIETSTVDENIPETGLIKPNKFALIIGNEDYTSYQTGLSVEQNVAFAKHDAMVFREYCVKTLGIPRDNIIFKINAGVVQMHQSLNQINSICKNMDGEAEIIFYYAGHGYPEKNTKQPYLIPVDVSSSSMGMAVPLNMVVDKLTEYSSQSVVMFLDACFTGGGRDLGLLASRGVKVVPNETQLHGNLIMFSATSIDQSALPYKKNSHGLFTYYLLKKLQDSEGKVTLSELDAYLKKQVSVKSTLIHSQEQNPNTFFSPEVKDSWENTSL